MSDYLFVYGSLRSGELNPAACFLQSRARHMGTGRMEGWAYSLGAYPGALLEEGCGHFVTGDIFLLDDPPLAFSVLDDYEGIGPEFPQPHEYLRRICPVHFQGGILSCWVYLYNPGSNDCGTAPPR